MNMHAHDHLTEQPALADPSTEARAPSCCSTSASDKANAPMAPALKSAAPPMAKGSCCAKPTQTSPGDVRDPVCGMHVDPATAQHRAEHAGHTYYFCSGRCREKFIAEPARYLAKSAATNEPAPEGTIYTCPMKHTLLPQTDANFESALSSYQVGAVDFTTLLDALRQRKFIACSPAESSPARQRLSISVT